MDANDTITYNETTTPPGYSEAAPSLDTDIITYGETTVPPCYSEAAPKLHTLIDEIKTTVSKGSLPITREPSSGRYGRGSEFLLCKAVDVFFSAIRNKQDDIVAGLIESGIVTANTKTHDGITPLLAATGAGDVRMVQKLMDFHADLNAYGRTQMNGSNEWRGVDRTPLQKAADEGDLTIVKLLMEVYHADDSLIAPDGQLALRLAIENGHREIADFLPARRGGGWLRWKAHHAKAVRRAKATWRDITEVFYFFFWKVPKYMFWIIPKEILRQIHKLPGWSKKQILKTPDRLRRLGKGIVRGVRAVPEITKKLAVQFWALLKAIASGLWVGLKDTASLLHSVAHAIITFLKRVTLQDILNGLRNIWYQLTVGLPKAIGRGIKIFLGGCYHCIKGLLRCLWLSMTWLPKSLFKLLKAIASSIGKGIQEVLLYLNPKGGMRVGA